MRLPQKIVAVIGKTSNITIKYIQDVQVISTDDIIEIVSIDSRPQGTLLCFKGIQKGRGSITVRVDEKDHVIKVAVFNKKEFFVSMVISSNWHLGQDPENCIRGCEHESLYNVTGHGFFKTCRTLEPVYHKHQVPITWLIDDKVAKDGKDVLEGFHRDYGDDYGLMPSSYFHHNSQNYNLHKSQDEVNEIVSTSLKALEDVFGTYTSVIGIDQWVGSVGSKFVKAAEYNGLKGVWGLGYDHYTCDTSMFHRGCPWDMYKPDRNNIKLPSKYPSDLWAFQWTTRDIINTVHTPDGKSSGSVIFSTDPDDIGGSGIMPYQRDYYDKMLQTYRDSMGESEFFVFLMHQEDHESHFENDNVYYDQFLTEMRHEEGVTFATLIEIEQWLNIIFKKEEHPVQLLMVDNPLTCQDTIVWQRTNRPDDWCKYNTHCAIYDQHRQVLFEKPNQKPFRVFDYEKDYPIEEMDSYPEEQYGIIDIVGTSINKEQCTLEIMSDAKHTNYPVAVWDIPVGLKLRREKKLMVSDQCLVAFVDLEKGMNTIVIDL